MIAGFVIILLPVAVVAVEVIAARAERRHRNSIIRGRDRLSAPELHAQCSDRDFLRVDEFESAWERIARQLHVDGALLRPSDCLRDLCSSRGIRFVNDVGWLEDELLRELMSVPRKLRESIKLETLDDHVGLIAGRARAVEGPAFPVVFPRRQANEAD